MGLGAFVFLIFLTLKLVNSIDWSWWWVTAPLWGELLCSVLVIAAMFIWPEKALRLFKQ